MGGSAERDVPENKVPLCRSCHNAKHQRVLRIRVRDGVFEWTGRGADVWISVPVRVNKRHGCLDFATNGPAAGEQSNRERGGQTPKAVASGISATPAAGSGRGEAGSAAAEDGVAQSAERRLGVTPWSADAGSSPAPDSSAAAPSFFPSGASDYCERGMRLLFMALRLQRMTTELAFEIGDWANEGETTLNEMAHQFFGVFSYWQIATWASVARRVPVLSRDKDLPLGHHRVVASLPEPEQQRLLDIAHQEHMNYRQLHELAHGPSEPRLEPMGLCPNCGHETAISEFRKGD